MARQRISLTKPNDDWLKAQVDREEYSSKSELVNDLIRQAREQQRQIGEEFYPVRVVPWNGCTYCYKPMIPLGSGSEWALWMDVPQKIWLWQCL